MAALMDEAFAQAAALFAQQQTGGTLAQVVVGYDITPARDTQLRRSRTRFTTPEQITAQLEPADQAVTRILQAPAAELRDYQRQLYIAGFYQAPFEEIRWGFAGPETILAASRFMTFAADFRTEAGEQPPWWEVLGEIVDASGGQDAFAPDPQVVVDLSDPAWLGALVDSVYSRMAGRRASETDKRAFVALVHGLQRQQALTLASARAQTTGGLIEDVGVSPEAQAVEFVQEQAGGEVAVRDTVTAAESLTEAIRRGSG